MAKKRRKQFLAERECHAELVEKEEAASVVPKLRLPSDRFLRHSSRWNGPKAKKPILCENLVGSAQGRLQKIAGSGTNLVAGTCNTVDCNTVTGTCNTVDTNNYKCILTIHYKCPIVLGKVIRIEYLYENFVM